MKKFMLTGVSPDVKETDIRQGLEKLGPVSSVQIIREGDAASPVVIVEMDITDAQAFQLTSRVTDYWHDGRMINVRLLLH